MPSSNTDKQDILPIRHCPTRNKDHKNRPRKYKAVKTRDTPCLSMKPKKQDLNPFSDRTKKYSTPSYIIKMEK
ncbi:Hypothetical protein CINCED_3A024629 [Cinara cedri]|uniref:Uncharacterized protein n=1 Tax=Cinara cedri TaxID=506608 RepID=A0A5E4MGT9_9HEMI|nr:Hypothetical protein CINCED_3A024629 [Cinara cedri]